jgi:hypothetical protein
LKTHGYHHDIAARWEANRISGISMNRLFKLQLISFEQDARAFQLAMALPEVFAPRSGPWSVKIWGEGRSGRASKLSKAIEKLSATKLDGAELKHRFESDVDVDGIKMIVTSLKFTLSPTHSLWAPTDSYGISSRDDENARKHYAGCERRAKLCEVSTFPVLLTVDIDIESERSQSEVDKAACNLLRRGMDLSPHSAKVMGYGGLKHTPRMLCLIGDLYPLKEARSLLDQRFLELFPILIAPADLCSRLSATSGTPPSFHSCRDRCRTLLSILLTSSCAR